MTDPDGAQALDYDALAAIADPVECARRITLLARGRGNLPAAIARLRKVRLIEARIEHGRKVDWLAAKVGLGASGISRLTSPLIKGAQA